MYAALPLTALWKSFWVDINKGQRCYVCIYFRNLIETRKCWTPLCPRTFASYPDQEFHISRSMKFSVLLICSSWAGLENVNKRLKFQKYAIFVHCAVAPVGAHWKLPWSERERRSRRQQTSLSSPHSSSLRNPEPELLTWSQSALFTRATLSLQSRTSSHISSVLKWWC